MYSQELFVSTYCENGNWAIKEASLKVKERDNVHHARTYYVYLFEYFFDTSKYSLTFEK